MNRRAFLLTPFIPVLLARQIKVEQPTFAPVQMDTAPKPVCPKIHPCERRYYASYTPPSNIYGSVSEVPRVRAGARGPAR